MIPARAMQWTWARLAAILAALLCVAAAPGPDAAAAAPAPVPGALEAQAEPRPSVEAPAIPLSGAGGAAAPEGEGQTLRAAARRADRSAQRSFRERVTGQTLTVGVSQAHVRLDLFVPGGSTLERYASGNDLTPSLSYYGAPLELLTFAPGSGIGGVWVFDLSGTVVGFSGRQTVQTNPDGSAADGKISGDYATFSAGTSLWLIRESGTLPLALRLGGSVGVGTVQYRGDLNHRSASGAAASGTIQNDGTSVQPVSGAEIEFRAAQVSLSARTVQFYDSGDSLLSSNGEPLARYRHRFRADVVTLGYAIEF